MGATSMHVDRVSCIHPAPGEAYPRRAIRRSPGVRGARWRDQRERDRARSLSECLPRVLRICPPCRPGIHERGRCVGAALGLRDVASSSRRGEHPARQWSLARSCPSPRLSSRRVLAALPEDRGPVARPRALGTGCGGLA